MRGITKKELTPYTQRPFEIYASQVLMPRFPAELRFEIEEGLGANRAPLAARMHFLKRHLKSHSVFEVWPKLSTSILALELPIRKDLLRDYRSLETGAQARHEILETMADRCEIFIYDRDLKKMTQSLSAFDALMCAYTALLSKTGHVQPRPKGYPKTASWVSFPKLSSKSSSKIGGRGTLKIGSRTS